MKEHPKLFTGLGYISEPYRIRVDETAQPVVHPARKVPAPLRGKVKDELNRMVKEKVIAKVNQPTKWVNSMVATEKKNSNKLRICIDPGNLNAAIQREHYQLPTIEEITSRLAGAKYFSKVDANSGYWQIPLDEESSFLTTFGTPFGRFCFLRLSFGLNCAQEVYHKRVHEMFDDMEGVETDIDDVLIFGRTKEEHDRNLKAALIRMQENNITLNIKKCVFQVTDIEYLGHILTQEGIRPDPKKLETIKNMPILEDKQAVQRLLGMVNFIAKFSPNVSVATEPLHELIKKDTIFQWTDHHTECFKNLKELLTSNDKLLKYYDVAKPVFVQVDSSKSGLGAALYQEHCPVAFASKALSETQQWYAQIEKECLAILFGIKRFHQYVYGKKVTVESDHKPLESIFKKPLVNAPARLQNMLLQLQGYDIDLVHKPGKELFMSDTLSRAVCSEYFLEQFEVDLDMEYHVHNVIKNVEITDRKLSAIQEENEIDESMKCLASVIRNGWPEDKANVPYCIREYWTYHDEMSIVDGIIFKGEKVLIPPKLRHETLGKLHAAHMGIEKTKHRARDIIFRPGMSKQIEEIVAKCSTCQERSRVNQKEPLKPHDLPTRPWQKTAVDFFEWDKREHIVAVDYFSRFYEVSTIGSTKASLTIPKLKSFFSRHGSPEEVVSWICQLC